MSSQDNNISLLSEQPFYKEPMTKQRSKKLTNQELLQVLSFYDDVGILRKRRAFKKYVETYAVETFDNKSTKQKFNK